jgi:hypothetical protein
MFGQPDQKNTVIDRVMEFNLQLEKYVPTKRNVILPSEDLYRSGSSSCSSPPISSSSFRAQHMLRLHYTGRLDADRGKPTCSTATRWRVEWCYVVERA